MAASPDAKLCPVCGRTIMWRAKWADDWEQVRYCSKACRRRGVKPVDEALERAVLQLLGERSRGATICPSEAARQVAAQRPELVGGGGGTGAGDEPWRALMEPARAAGRRLTSAGRVQVVQRGKVVDPDRAKGPIRLRLRS
jgi:hypothetical protein